MRIMSQKQLYLKPVRVSYSRGDELSEMPEVLGNLGGYGELLSRVLGDLNPLDGAEALLYLQKPREDRIETIIYNILLKLSNKTLLALE